MDAIIAEVSRNFEGLLLIFIRVSALLYASPVFGRKAIPAMAKAGLCAFIAYIVFGAYTIPVIRYAGLWHYAMLCILELMFGVALGYITTLFFSVAQTAGHAIDMQMGFGMVNVFDVQSNISVPMSGNFLNIILLIAFFGAGGHRQLIAILLATFNTVPPGQVAISAAAGAAALKFFCLAFVMALNVAMPIIASGLLGELIMGFVVRTVPQMNIFVVGI
ncbi:MAG: flagellar biosynthetic protein FliR [Christensenellales bacterium]|jgi:flagellar biosynthetic protein FliR